MSISRGMQASSPPTDSGGRTGFGGSGLGSAFPSLALLSFSLSEKMATLLARFIKLCLTRCFLAARSSSDVAAVEEDASSGLTGFAGSTFGSGFGSGLNAGLGSCLGGGLVSGSGENRNLDRDQGGADRSRSESDELASLGMQSVLRQPDNASDALPTYNNISQALHVEAFVQFT